MTVYGPTALILLLAAILVAAVLARVIPMIQAVPL